MSVLAERRRSGAKLDLARFEHELARRGLTHAQLAKRANVATMTLSRGVAGHQLDPRTLSRIAAALLEVPPIPGIDLLIGPPQEAA